MLTVFTVANTNYEAFVMPYIVSVLAHNSDAVVEIALQNPGEFLAANREAIEVLDRHFEGRYLISPGDFSRLPANTVRFVETPKLVNEYVYIGDIDILILEPIMSVHLENLKRTGLPYSNILRPPEYQALTGLHFSRWDAFYPHAPNARLDRLNTDEGTLYDLVQARGLPLPDPNERFRPVHGFHLSLNRDPRSAEGAGLTWGGIRNPEYALAYAKLRSSPLWLEIVPCFDEKYRRVLFILETMLAARFKDELAGTKPSPGITIKAMVDDERQIDSLTRVVAKRDGQIAALDGQIAALHSSTSWRVTKPLRALSRGLRWLLRNTRRALMLAWRLGTGQFSRAANALLPYYRRHVPLRVKAMIPDRVRELAKRRLHGRPRIERAVRSMQDNPIFVNLRQRARRSTDVSRSSPVMKMDPYSTHQALLTAAMLRTDGRILEMGGGWYSTPLISAFAHVQGRRAFTVETSEYVYNIFKPWGESERHKVLKIDGYDFDQVGKFKAQPGHSKGHYIELQRAFLERLTRDLLDRRWAVVFVDQAPGFLRVPAIEFFADRADYIITHDTEHVQHYGFEPCLSRFRYRWDFQLHKPNATIVSNTHRCDIFQFLYPEAPTANSFLSKGEKVFSP